MQSFHNTIQANWQQLLTFEESAKSQERVVLAIFRQVGNPMAYFEAAKYLAQPMDEVSLKRAISNLAKEHKNKQDVVIRKAYLVKTNEMVNGPKGKPCHKYALL